MIKPKIRPAEDSDIPAITEIYHEAVSFGTASFEYEPPNEAEMLRRFHALQTNNYPYFIIADGDTLLGYAYAGQYRARAAYDWTVENSIYMHKDARGKGLGKPLMQKLIDEAERRGFCQMISTIGGSDNIASIKLHLSLGFSHIGTFPKVGWKFERWHDSVMMQKTLQKNIEQTPQST